MKRSCKSVIALITILSLVFGLSTLSVVAEEASTQTIPLLSLGDSIAAGHGLANYDPADITKASESYINLLGVAMGSTPVNLAKDGLTSANLLQLLGNAGVKEKLAVSEVITVSIGGNNVLQPMMATIKTEFGLSTTADNDQLTDKINEVGLLESLGKAQKALIAAQPALDQGVKAFETEFPQIVDQLKAVAPQARILVSTLYYPYGGIKFQDLDFDAATLKQIKGINAVITKTLGETKYVGAYEIVDVSTAFGAKPALNVNVSLPYNLDPHPSALGHQLIFELYAKQLVAGFTSFKFTDIHNHPAKNSIRFLAGLGIVSGSNNLYRPDGQLTRAEFLKILCGAVEGLNVPAAQSSGFVDVPQGEWYAKYVNWAVEKQITSGKTKTEFQPKGNITRQELAAMQYRLLKSSGYVFPVISESELYADDAQMASYAKESIYALKASGFLVEQTGEKFNPTAQATRADAAMILANYVRITRK